MILSSGCLGVTNDYTGCIKMSRIYKIASKLVYLQNYGYQQQPTANIGLQVCISVNFVFIIMFNFVSRGEFKMLYFQVACAQKFQTKNDFFCAAYSMQIWNVVMNL